MATISKSFTDVGASAELSVAHGDSFSYSLSGTYAQTLAVQKSADGGISWEDVAGPFSTADASVSGVIMHESRDRKPANYRWYCSVDTSGTSVTTLVEADRETYLLTGEAGATIIRATETSVTSLVRTGQKRLITMGAKVGATSGWLVKAADNKNSLARCPASQTGSTLVVPISGLKVGDTITGVHLLGQIESAGNAVTLDMSFRKQSVAAADLADAEVVAMTQISVIADTAISSSNSSVSCSDVVGADESFYVLLTATTLGSTDIDLAGVAVIVSEA